MEFEIFLQLNKYYLETQQFTVTHGCFIPHRNKVYNSRQLNPFAMVSFEAKTSQFRGEKFLKASSILGIVKP